MTEHATTQEIMDAFCSLTSADKRVLHALARKHLPGTQFSEPLDLVHEALHLAVEGRRRWPVAVQFAIFMFMTIRSVAFADRTLSENAKAGPISSNDHLERTDVEVACHPSAEEAVERDEDRRQMWTAIATARNHLAKRDAVAARVLEQIVAEEPTSEIRRRLRLRAAELDAARKRALRAVRNPARL